MMKPTEDLVPTGARRHRFQKGGENLTQVWLIDGMNLIGSRPNGWWKDPDRAMRALAGWLEEYVELTGEYVVLVFDRQPSDFQPPASLNVVLVSSGGRNAADYVIERLVYQDPELARLRVVTSDKRFAERVERRGGRVTGSARFRTRLERALAG
jgi:predicted RNA-binding protein with PIN domain